VGALTFIDATWTGRTATDGAAYAPSVTSWSPSATPTRNARSDLDPEEAPLLRADRDDTERGWASGKLNDDRLSRPPAPTG